LICYFVSQTYRLAIARAFYQNSSILILDEATSALDSKSELLVRQAVERLMENRTVWKLAFSVICHVTFDYDQLDKYLLCIQFILFSFSCDVSLISISHFVAFSFQYVSHWICLIETLVILIVLLICIPFSSL
jgi:ABC-type taurine transport system ATPase subunit